MQKITYNITGQSLYIDIPEGRASGTPTFEVFDLFAGDDSTTQFSGNASADDVNTTVDAASGNSETNRKTINLASTSDIVVGREYLLTATTGESELVEVASITDGASVTAKHPLQNDYAANSTFVGIRLTAPVDSTWVADKANLSDTTGHPGYRVLWKFTIAGESKARYSYFDLVRAPSSHVVTVNDLEVYYPGITQKLDRDLRGNTDSIFDAAHSEVRLALKASEIDDDQVRDQLVYEQLITYKALEIIAARGHHPSDFTPLEFVEYWRDRFHSLINAHVVTTQKTAIATDTSGASDIPPTLPIAHS